MDDSLIELNKQTHLIGLELELILGTQTGRQWNDNDDVGRLIGQS